MKQRKSTSKMVIPVMIILLMTALMMSGCSGNKVNRDTVYEDLQSAFEESQLLSANIGLYTKVDKDGTTSYGNGGSGIIFQKDDQYYYALTSAHVVAGESPQLLIYTVNTEMKTENIPGVNMNVLAEETYDAMYSAEVLFTSTRDDLAVIRFAADEDLSVIEIADADPQKGDRILCVGNPENEWFSVTYGEVMSDLKRFGESTGYPSNVMEHNAYMNVGSSGGAAIGEDMKLVGITPGIFTTLDRNNVEKGLLIPVSEIKLCLEEWQNQ